MSITTNQPVELNIPTHGAEQSGRRVYTYTDVLGSILPAGTSVVADILIKFDENRYDTNEYYVTLSTLGSNATFLAVVTFNYEYYIPERISGGVAFNQTYPIQSSETCTGAFLAKRLDNIVVRTVLERGQDCGDWQRYAANSTCTYVLPLPDEFYLGYQ